MEGQAVGKKPLDRAFDTLSEAYRRRVLLELLVVPPGTGHRPEGDRIAAHHVHLPKLDDFGYVRWDRESGRVTRGPSWSEIEPIVRMLHERSDDLPAGWPRPD